MSLTLSSLVEVLLGDLTRLRSQLQMLKNKQLVIPLGYTGSGKSTMLQALCFGSSNLKKQRGKIVLKDEAASEGAFKIGHSPVTSETFEHEFLERPGDSIVYGDIAGLADSNGPFIDIVNSFRNRILF